MTGMKMWLDDQTLQNLKSIARKLTLPGKPSLSAEEVRAVTKLKQKKSMLFLVRGKTGIKLFFLLCVLENRSELYRMLNRIQQ
jgi:hypothetical protein